MPRHCRWGSFDNETEMIGTLLGPHDTILLTRCWEQYLLHFCWRAYLLCSRASSNVKGRAYSPIDSSKIKVWRTVRERGNTGSSISHVLEDLWRYCRIAVSWESERLKILKRFNTTFYISQSWYPAVASDTGAHFTSHHHRIVERCRMLTDIRNMNNTWTGKRHRCIDRSPHIC